MTRRAVRIRLGHPPPSLAVAAISGERRERQTRPTLSYEWDTKRGKAISKTATATSMEKSGERSYFAVAVGLLLMSAIALTGLEVFARLWANTGMIR